MNYLHSKRGLSEVVATVMLIMLSVAAVGIIAGVLVPWMKDYIDKGSSCVEYNQGYFYFSEDEEIAYNCYKKDSTDYVYAVTISAKGTDNKTESEIGGMKIIFSAEGDSKAVDVTEGSPVSSEIKMLQKSETKFEIPKGGETRTYLFTSDKKYTRASAAPVLKSGRTCEQTPSISISTICELNMDVN